MCEICHPRECDWLKGFFCLRIICGCLKADITQRSASFIWDANADELIMSRHGVGGMHEKPILDHCSVLIDNNCVCESTRSSGYASSNKQTNHKTIFSFPKNFSILWKHIGIKSYQIKFNEMPILRFISIFHSIKIQIFDEYNWVWVMGRMGRHVLFSASRRCKHSTCTAFMILILFILFRWAFKHWMCHVHLVWVSKSESRDVVKHNGQTVVRHCWQSNWTAFFWVEFHKIRDLLSVVQLDTCFVY